MQVQEPLLGEAHHSKNMHEPTTNESDGEEETLSLCDLPLYSNSNSTSGQSVDQWEQQEFSGQDSQYGGSTSSQDEYFEFSSQEFNAAADFPPENIIFCGKLIPFKQPHHHHQHPITQKDDNTQTLVMNIESKKKRIELWKKSSSSNGSKSTTVMMQQQHSLKKTKTYNTNKLNMSLFTSSSSSGKTKWYFLFFGIPRFSTDVELRDIKNRRSFHRQFSSSPPASPPQPMFRFENLDDDDNEVFNGERNRGWGLWGMMIKVLSCGGNHHSVGCSTPRVRGS